MILRKPLFLSFLIILVLFSLPLSAWAANEGTQVKIGQDIYVDENESYDALVAVGGDIKVDGTANTVVSIGGNIEIQGDIKDAVVAIGGDVLVNKTVNGDVVIIGGSASLGPDAIIKGDLVMVGVNLIKDSGAQVIGSQTEISVSEFLTNFPEKFVLFGISLATIFFAFFLFGIMLMGLFILLIGLLFPQGLANSKLHALASPGKAFLFGLLLTIFFLPISFVLLITIIGIPLLLLFWLAYGILAIWGLAVITELIGAKVTSLLGYKGDSLVLKLLVGIILFVFISQIPFVGWTVLVLIKIMAIGIGVISHLGFRTTESLVN